MVFAEYLKVSLGVHGIRGPAAGAARLREERCANRAVAEAGMPGDRTAGQVGARRHLWGRRNGATQ